MHRWADWVEGECRAVEVAGRWRQVVDLDESLVNFASNDYLGLSRHPSVVAAAHGALDRWGAGAGAARLVAGSRPVHGDLEAALAAWKREPAALLFPTGYAANLGVLTTFGGPGVRVDTAVYPGYVVPPYYDSMIAKLIVHARTRDLAIARMRRALEAMVVEGIKTTIPLHLKIMNDEKFQNGDFSTKFMEEFAAAASGGK